MGSAELLPILDAEVEARCQAVAEARPDWPCRAGCADCCRALAVPMEVSDAEWARVEDALEALGAEGERLRGRLDAWTDARACPLLGDDERCSIYAARPLACRTYGFYVAGDGKGLWCAEISALEGLENTVLGHERGIDGRLSRPRRTWSEWTAAGRPR